ncbi:MAG: hypothetical protein E6G97_07735 [Alphaproteobacteria bacterium]|nr:MAG: hypothetical protein E6G97_07735 [Alphaproteobacteria bacterium]
MQLIQILLPLYDNSGEPLPAELFSEVRQQLADRFGGLTTYSRAPAQGLWKDDGETHHDDIVVFEVMAARLDAAWWGEYRRNLEARFRQREIVIRAQETVVL